MIGMPDTWTAFQFDSAVSHFGVWIENKLNEMDYNSKPIRPKHKLADLLSEAPKPSILALTGKGISHGLSTIRRVKPENGTTA